MPSALILPLENCDAGIWLAALRQVVDERSRSDPHVTVRYPIKRIDRDAISSSLQATINTLDIEGPGVFRIKSGIRSVIFLSCKSELLESFSYKPDFPDSVFHVTLFEGETSDFSEKLLSLLYEQPWNLRARLSPPTKLKEISIGRGAGQTKRAERFTVKVLGALSKIHKRYADTAYMENLDVFDRLKLVSSIIERMHNSLTPYETTNRRSRVRRLKPLAEYPKQQELWSSSPVPISDARHQLSGKDARRGNPVLTPPELVEQIVHCALQTHGDTDIRFGDPAFGSGIFFAVLARLTSNGPSIIKASAVEINPERAKASAKRWQSRGLNVFVGDFLTGKPNERWNLILANPPYVRSQNIDDETKEFVANRIEASLQIRVPRRSNMFVYFMLACHDWMEPNATAAWLLPADFLQTKYGSVLRDYLTTRVSLTRIHTYDPKQFRFENVRVSSTVVVFRNSQPDTKSEVLISRGGSIAKPENKGTTKTRTLNKRSSWRLLAIKAAGRNRKKTGSAQLGDIFRIRRGIATGANEYFVLREEEIEECGIERKELRHLLPRSRFMPTDNVIHARADGTPKVERQLFLVDADDELDVLAERAPNLVRYLRNAPRYVLERLLVSRRNPFYRQENRPATQLIASNMGRFQRAKDKAPVQFYLNLSNATALNNYLLMYPKSTGRHKFAPSVARNLFEILRNIDENEYRIWGREYSGGMYKLEPRELANVRLDLSREELAHLIGLEYWID